MTAPTHTPINTATDGLVVMEPIPGVEFADLYPDLYAPDVQATVEERLAQIIYELNRASRFIRAQKQAQIETLIGGVADEINGFRVFRQAESPSLETSEYGDIWLQPDGEGAYTPRVFNGVGFVEDLYAVEAILIPLVSRISALESEQAEVFQDAIDVLRASLVDGATTDADTFGKVEAALDALTTVVAGKRDAGAVAASDITGVLDPARIPPSVRAAPQVSSGAITDLTTDQQNNIGEGSPVLLADGRVLYYKGTGSKTDEASYVIGADQTPAEAQIPALPISKTTGLQDALDAKVTAAGGNASATVVTATGASAPQTQAAREALRRSVKDFGALGDGTTDDTAAFTAAAATGAEVLIPPGAYSLTAPVSGIWRAAQGVTWVTAANYAKPDVPAYWTGGQVMREPRRAFFGRAAKDVIGANSAATAESPFNTYPYSLLSYLLTRPQTITQSPIGSVAAAAMSQSVDNDRSGERVSGGYFGFAINNKNDAANKKSAWALYGHAHQEYANHFTAAIEVDASTFVEGALADPYSLHTVGTVVAAAFGVGGETAEAKVAGGQGADMREISAILTLINQSSGAAQNRAKAGIVFHALALSGTDGTGTGTAPAIVFARGHELVWKYSSGANAKGGVIRSDGNSAGNHQRLIFGATAFDVKGVQGDLITETTLFRVVAPTMGSGQTPNGISVVPVFGAAPQIAPVGPDTNIDLSLSPKGTGVVRFGTYAAISGETLAGYITIKDAAGTSRKVAVIA